MQARLESLASQWEELVAKSTEKSEKLKDASRQQTYNAGVKDMEFWLGEVCYPNSFHCLKLFLFFLLWVGRGPGIFLLFIGFLSPSLVKLEVGGGSEKKKRKKSRGMGIALHQGWK